MGCPRLSQTLRCPVQREFAQGTCLRVIGRPVTTRFFGKSVRTDKIAWVSSFSTPHQTYLKLISISTSGTNTLHCTTKQDDCASQGVWRVVAKYSSEGTVLSANRLPRHVDNHIQGEWRQDKTRRGKERAGYQSINGANAPRTTEPGSCGDVNLNCLNRYGTFLYLITTASGFSWMLTGRPCCINSSPVMLGRGGLISCVIPVI
jgi:hypothetical protein